MSESNVICPICEIGQLSLASHDLDVKHGDRVLKVTGLEHSVCDACGETPVLTDQIRRNQQRVADAKRAADDLLPGAEVRAVRAHLGLTQADAARMFGGGANAFSKYERGEVVQSTAMDLLLRVAREVPAATFWLRARASRHALGVAGAELRFGGSTEWVELEQDTNGPLSSPFVSSFAVNDDSDWHDWRATAAGGAN